jgi:hypothetical protein
MKKIALFSALVVLTATILIGFSSCQKTGKEKEMEINNVQNSEISQQVINEIISELVDKYGDTQKNRIERGVNQTANLWDDSEENFKKFCSDNFVGNSDDLQNMFVSVQNHFETLLGNLNRISLDLKKPVHLDNYRVSAIDEIFAGYDPSANLANDLYKNKIAFHISLNFPYYTLKEKEEFAEKWTRTDWAYARLGDVFTSRMPAELLQKYSETLANADYYISNYNILMGFLVDNNGKKLFPEDMKLITHWNLRDELKSQYGKENGLERQKIIFEVMQRIIKQEIPEKVINNNEFTWNPFSNKVFEAGKEIEAKSEPNTRYQHLLNAFLLNKQIDEFRPNVGNAINATFDVQYEMPQENVEKMFIEFISSPQVKQIAEIIKQKLGRDLQPFDIWFDGFKSRSSINQEELDKKIKQKYPNTQAFQNDIPNILTKLGFSKSKAAEISSHIIVEPSKGAGHAWGAEMKGEKAHLRTRIGAGGMDYKGYNIAIHELGHNVEQTLTLHDVDNWFMRGVPNTAFTEAWAFAFQAKDLNLLGIKNENSNASSEENNLAILDKFWSCYEIMGVSLVDQRVWKWMYENPDASTEDLKNAVIKIANEVWNSYYSPVFGIKDCPILAIYSHMIDYPLYLSAYPIGHLIEFQIDEFIKGKNLGEEMIRMCVQGKLIPDFWMKQAVGNEVSVKPLLEAAGKAASKIK